MRITELRLIKYIRLNPARTVAMVLAGLSAVICGISTAYHYTNRFPGNPVSWISWLTGMLFLLIAFFPTAAVRPTATLEPPGPSLQEKPARINRKDLIFFGGLCLLVILLYFWNFRTAPWNQNGLFDDAAWDIYFMKHFIFSGQPFQAAWFDGGVSREVIYHYYLYAFFNLFGYNLLVFKIALMVLGLTTVLFTSLLIQRMLKNYWVTALAAVVFILLPFHYVHTFEGHRYAMAYPLMMVSFYLLYTGFKNKAPFRVVLSAIFAALLNDSAIMGKQYLMCLFGALLVSMILHYRKFFNRPNWNNAKLFGFSLVVAMMPLIIYIYYNPIYFLHESDLTNQFLAAYQTGGINGILPYFQKTYESFFAPSTYWRRFNQDFVTLPFAYYIFLLPGILIAIYKKRYEIFFMALLPVAGATLSGCWDFRYLHALPFWIISMALTFKVLMDFFGRMSLKSSGSPKSSGTSGDTLQSSGLLDSGGSSQNGVESEIETTPENGATPEFENIPEIGATVEIDTTPKTGVTAEIGTTPEIETTPETGEPPTIGRPAKPFGRILGFGLIAVVLLFGLVPSVQYINAKAKDPNSIWLFPQKDVAVSRFLRDVVAGVPNPSPKMRWQEFKKLKGYPEPGYDCLIAQNFGFAITHLFLYDYDDNKIMSFSGGAPFNLLSESELLGANIQAIRDYQKTTKDLKLIWEVDDKTKRIIELFRPFNSLGSDQILASEHAGRSFQFYVLTIKNDRIDELKARVLGLTL